MRINRLNAVQCAIVAVPLGVLGLFAILLYIVTVEFHRVAPEEIPVRLTGFNFLYQGGYASI